MTRTERVHEAAHAVVLARVHDAFAAFFSKGHGRAALVRVARELERPRRPSGDEVRALIAPQPEAKRGLCAAKLNAKAGS